MNPRLVPRALVLGLAALLVLATALPARPARRPRYEPLELSIQGSGARLEPGGERELTVRLAARIPLRDLELRAFGSAGVEVVATDPRSLALLEPGHPLAWRVKVRTAAAGARDAGVAVDVSFPMPPASPAALVDGDGAGLLGQARLERAREAEGFRQRSFLAVALEDGEGGP